jgi:molecular chaperone GrpE
MMQMNKEEKKQPEIKKVEELKKITKENEEIKKLNYELSELKNKNSKLEQTLKEMNDKTLRLTADIQNMGKRHSDELANSLKYEGFDLIKQLLPIVDNFERSIAMDTSLDEKYLSGYKMIYTNMLNVLKSIGVTELDCLDKPFDPNTMQAILTEHVDKKDKDIVILVLQKGYLYKDKLLRPAMVKVSC